jgi:hypothetical protein
MPPSCREIPPVVSMFMRAQKATLTREDGVDSMVWISGYDPVTGRNKTPIVPVVE